MKRFFSKITKFIVPFLFVIIGCLFLFKFLIKKNSDFSLPKNINTIILGHSQPEAAFNDSLILNAKNLCNGGEAYLYTYKKLQIVLNHNPQIKKVYISFSNNQIILKMDSWLYDETHLDQYFSKYNFEMDKDDYSLAFKNNFTGTCKAESKAIILNAKRILKHKNAFENNEFGGYLYLKRFKTDSLLQHNYINVLKKEQSNKISIININYLKKIVKFCNDKNVKIYFVRTPIHSVLFSILNEKQFQEIRKVNFPNVPFLDFHDFPIANDEFGDFDHLNYKGAKKFSAYFDSVIKN